MAPLIPKTVAPPGHECVFEYIYVCIVCVCVCARAYLSIYMYALCVCVCVYAHSHPPARAQARTHTFAHTCTPIYSVSRTQLYITQLIYIAYTRGYIYAKRLKKHHPAQAQPKP
jgi:hypothetical protein